MTLQLEQISFLWHFITISDKKIYNRKSVFTSVFKINYLLIFDFCIFWQHQQLRDEIDTYAPEYAKIKEFGDKVTEGQESDPQYMFLKQVDFFFS